MFINIKQLQTLFLISLGGQVILFIILYYLMSYPYRDDLGGRGMLISLSVLFVLYLLTVIISQSRIKKGVQLPDKETKWDHYIWTVILRLAGIETAIIITMVLMWLSNNRLLVIPLVLGLIIYLQYKPDNSQFEEWYLPYQEEE